MRPVPGTSERTPTLLFPHGGPCGSYSDACAPPHQAAACARGCWLELASQLRTCCHLPTWPPRARGWPSPRPLLHDATPPAAPPCCRLHAPGVPSLGLTRARPGTCNRWPSCATWGGAPCWSTSGAAWALGRTACAACPGTSAPTTSATASPPWTQPAHRVGACRFPPAGLARTAGVQAQRQTCRTLGKRCLCGRLRHQQQQQHHDGVHLAQLAPAASRQLQLALLAPGWSMQSCCRWRGH